MIYKITNDLLNKFIIEFNKDENRKKINVEIIDPIINDISNRLYPYMIIIFIMYILIIVLIITILFILIIRRKK